MSNPIAIHFEMQAPHGTRIYPTMTGCRIEYTAASKAAVETWLQSEATRFGQSNLAPEDTVPCPKCGGELKMAGNVPLFCSLCHGALRIGKTTAASYVASLNQPQMVVREQQFDEPSDSEQGSAPPPSPHDMLRQVLHDQLHPTAVPITNPAKASAAPEAVYSIAQLIPNSNFPVPARSPREVIVHAAIPVEAYLAPPDLLPGMTKSSTVVIEEDE
jgi:hypothetical protein